MKLTKLTKEQEHLMHSYRKSVLEKFFDPEKQQIQSDERITELTKKLYSFCGLEDPKVIIVESPFTAMVIAYLLQGITGPVSDQVKSQIGGLVGSQMWDQIGDQIGRQVRDQVEDQIWSRIWDQVKDQIWSQIGRQVRDQVEDQIWSQIWSQIGNQMRDQVEDQIGGLSGPSFAYYGNISDYHWVAFFNFFKKIGIEFQVPFFEEFSNLVFSGIYDMIQFEKVAIVCKLPNEIHRDNSNNLHNKTGPAIKWKDGYSLYFIHGVAISREWIVKGVSIDTINKESNSERKRIAIDLYGYANYIRDTNAKMIDSFPTYKLYEFPENLKVLECVDSTPENFDEEDDESSAVVRYDDFRQGEVAIPGAKYKRYFLRVPSSMKSAKEAVAWTYYMSEEEYDKAIKNLIET